MDSSATSKSKPEQLYDASVIRNDEVNLPTTLTELPEANHFQRGSNERVADERKPNEAEAVSENATSTIAGSLKLDCNDDGLIVIKTDVQQLEETGVRVFNEGKNVARTK